MDLRWAESPQDRLTLRDHLKSIYLRTLDACSPERLIRTTPDMTRSIVAIGKCAGALRDGLDDDVDAFVTIPSGNRRPRKRAHVVEDRPRRRGRRRWRFHHRNRTPEKIAKTPNTPTGEYLKKMLAKHRAAAAPTHSRSEK
jgi:hypothetical protein